MSQSYLNGNSIILDESTRSNIEFYTGSYSELITTNSHPHFLIAICSDVDYEQQNNSVFSGEQILKKSILIEKLVKSIYESNSYKVGHVILLPFKLLKKGIKKIFR